MRLKEADALIQQMAQESEVCRRLDAIPGIGPITATALMAAIGNGAAFRKGRDFAAWARDKPFAADQRNALATRCDRSEMDRF